MLPSPEMAAPRTEADSDQSPHFSLAITAFDEGARLPRSLERVMPWLAAQPFTSEVVINDDGSTDDTAAVVERFGARYPGQLRLLRSPLNQGKGAGLRRAVLATRGAVVLVSDADLSTPIEEAPRLLAALEAGADVVIGSRIQPDGSDMRASQPRYRRLVGRLFHRLADPLVVRGIPDTQSGFKAFRGDIARELFGGTSLTSIVYDVEVLHLAQRRGYRVDSVPVQWTNATGSRMRVTPGHAWRVFYDLLRIPWLHRQVGQSEGPPPAAQPVPDSLSGPRATVTRKES
ncbi:MAG TPA: dolichyl-phosphate beta-glucosyltransferase [Chloroflexota bacterium]|nr:dolichyl-phosphate beta-glucosyltransferase [Chloroflexota bacterium]